MTPILNRPLISFVVMVVALYATYALLPPTFKDAADTALVLSLSFAFTWAAVLMVRRTRVWTERGLGLLGTVTGDALLYLAIGLGAMLGLRGHVLDLARACLTVGVVLLLIGLTRSIKDERIIENAEPTDGLAQDREEG